MVNSTLAIGEQVNKLEFNAIAGVGDTVAGTFVAPTAHVALNPSSPIDITSQPGTAFGSTFLSGGVLVTNSGRKVAASHNSSPRPKWVTLGNGHQRVGQSRVWATWGQLHFAGPFNAVVPIVPRGRVLHEGDFHRFSRVDRFKNFELANSKLELAAR